MDKKEALQKIDNYQSLVCSVSDKVWGYAETAFEEYQSMNTICEALKELGFTIETGIGNIETAFLGRYGHGKPVIGVLGEYDALSAMNQKSESVVKESDNPTASGHGCGHNLLGSAGIAAVAAVKEYLEHNHQTGTIIYYGCPGEEGGSGKAFMARDGVFDELDAAVTWHPNDSTVTMTCSSLANYQVAYKFTGISSHAAASPHLGRSALDAVELMNIGVQFLREHIIQEARVHYAITNAGGFSPNVVQPNAEVLYLIRAPKNEQVKDIYERINDIARGAALMTGTKVEIDFIKACSNIVPNMVLCELMHNNLQKVPFPTYTKEEYAFADQMFATINNKELPAMIANMYSSEEINAIKATMNGAINETILPLSKRETVMPGSTDVGDVSWVCPTVQAFITTEVIGTAHHSWQMVSQGKSGIAHKGMLYAGKVMAGTIIDLMENPDKIAEAKQELHQRLEGGKYIPPIPSGVTPRKMTD